MILLIFVVFRYGKTSDLNFFFLLSDTPAAFISSLFFFFKIKLKCLFLNEVLKM